MKRFCKLFALLLALTLALTACGGGAGDDGDAANNGQSGDNTATEETTMDLGYQLTLMNVSHYAGAFVEDGSDDIVSDVMVITVRNDGDKTVQYAHITLTVGETAYEFDLTTLPVGASAYLLELSRQTEPESTEGMMRGRVMWRRIWALFAPWISPISSSSELMERSAPET